jgi:uncharacterized membrane protein
MKKLAVFFNRCVFNLAKHWLLFLNLLVAIYAGLPLLAPLLMTGGYAWLARAIYTAYKPACHQLPWRSFFFFGYKATYSYRDLQELVGPEKFANFSLARSFLGNAFLGYKMAYCQRDAAIYTSILIGGLAFSLVRKNLKPLPLKIYVVSLIPFALDGLTQLFGLRESTPLLRIITGSIFGIATVWLVYPHLEEGMLEIQRTIGGETRNVVTT